MRSARVLFFVVSFFSLVLFSPKISHAQTSTPLSQSSPSSFTTPNTDPGVARNQHTYAQAVTIEVLSAIMCQLTGVDPVDPSSSCLGINPQTHKLGYAPAQQSSVDKTKIGGLVGITTDMIATTYRPVVTTRVYTQYLSDNFGIVKKTYAASVGVQNGYGFEALRPVFELWKAVRNIAYALLVFAFVFIGVGIMLRVKIDPRTVMTIQNQIPKVIVAIILITLSYAISALMVDLMWVSTYAGVNLITNSSDGAKKIDAGEGPGSFSTKATRQLLEIPLVYVNDVFHTGGCTKTVDFTCTGIAHVTGKVSSAMGTVLQDVVESLLGVDKGDSCVGGGKFGLDGVKLPGVHIQACLADAFGFIAKVVLSLVMLAVLIVALFKIWFNLLKSYIYSLVYIIVAPVMIVFGLLPSKPMGFENWLRRLFVNIAIFPITAFIIVAARLLMDTYNTKLPEGTPDVRFIPPLIGHNASANFGSLLAFGAILLTPHLQTILQEKMGVKGIGSPGLVSAGIAGGAAVIGAPVGRAIKHLNRTDSRGGKVGTLAVGKEKAGNFALGIPAKLGSKYAARKIEVRKGLQGADYLSGHKSATEIIKDAKGNIQTSQQARDSVKSPRSWLNGRRDAKETRREERRTAGEDGTTPSRRRWRDRIRFRKNNGHDDPPGSGRPTPPLPPTPTGGAGGAATGTGSGAAGATKSGATGTTRGAGTGGPVTLTGPVTLAHPVPIPHAGPMKDAKRNLVQDMYGRYKNKTKEYGDKGKQNITVHIEKAIEGKGPDEINKLDESKWKELVQNAEQAEENGGGSTGGAPKA